MKERKTEYITKHLLRNVSDQNSSRRCSGAASFDNVSVASRCIDCMGVVEVFTSSARTVGTKQRLSLLLLHSANRNNEMRDDRKRDDGRCCIICMLIINTLISALETQQL